MATKHQGEKESVQCKKRVRDRSNPRWPTYHQCSLKAKKDGWCTIHHPDYVKAQGEKREAKWDAERRSREIARATAPFLGVISWMKKNDLGSVSMNDLEAEIRRITNG